MGKEPAKPAASTDSIASTNDNQPTKEEVRQAKDRFSIHQDNLFWSRTQTLIGLQVATLGGTYALQATILLAVGLMLFGIALTVILWIIAERDQDHRDLAFAESGLPPTRLNNQGMGRLLIRIVFTILISADAFLLGWLLRGISDFLVLKS